MLFNDYVHDTILIEDNEYQEISVEFCSGLDYN